MTREPDAIGQLVASGAGVSILPSSLGTRLAKTYRTKFLALNEDWSNFEYKVCVVAEAHLPAIPLRFIEGLSAMLVREAKLQAA